MNLNSLITGPARIGLTLGGRLVDLVRSRLGGSTQIDDDTLRERVEADVFSSRRVPRSKVELEVAEGVVWLRGEVKSKAVAEEVEARAGAIEGVSRVENLLRVAKAPQKPKTQKPKTQKRPAPKRSARPKPAAATAPPPKAEPAPAPTPPPAAQEEREVTRRFNAESTPAEAEPGPAELAETGRGRQPAPLGSGEGGSPPAPFPTVANGAGSDDGAS
ncbi:MAG TPA: BON domain-containing protein [Thermoleophilaceae bacterium]|jgi:outer membrane biosynthesis protein TonB